MSPSENMGSRRAFLLSLAGLSSLALSGCLEMDSSSPLWPWLTRAESWNQWVFGLDLPRERRVKTYSPGAITSRFPINSLNLPPGYENGTASEWQDWRLRVNGLVQRPLSLSLAELRSWPSVSEITRLDCVEGWSAIARWTGVRLAEVLDRAGVLPSARYVVCHSADYDLSGTPFYGSLDLASARHPQTLLAYGFNGRVPLPLDHGAPLRLRLPTQLGYKSTKFIHQISLVSELDSQGAGKGGYWEDQGYAWYAGV